MRIIPFIQSVSAVKTWRSKSQQDLSENADRYALEVITRHPTRSSAEYRRGVRRVVNVGVSWRRRHFGVKLEFTR